MRLLEILEVDVEKLRPIEHPTQFEKIIIPDGCFLALNGFTKEYRETIDRVRNFALKNRTPTPYKKIYYFHGQRQIGEERLAEYFKSKGYEVVRPETLPLDEQLNLLINAESFASTIGSTSHNSIFLRDGTETILIPRLNCMIVPQQVMAHQVHEQNVNYVDASLSALYKINGPFYYMISKQLKEFFGDKFDGYEEEDFKNFLQYVKDSFERGNNFREAVIRRCDYVFQDFMAQLKQRKDLIAAQNMPLNWDTFQSQMPDGLSYQTHVHKRSWGDGWKQENQISNDIEQQLDIQAIKINFPGHKVYYSVYYNDEEGWSEEVLSPEPAGTIGKSKSIYGIRIRFDETGAKEFDILYRVHKFDGAWTSWAKNGENLYSNGQKLNAIQIKLEPKT